MKCHRVSAWEFRDSGFKAFGLSVVRWCQGSGFAV